MGLTKRFRDDVFTRRESELLDLRYADVSDDGDNERLCKMVQRDIDNGEEELVTADMHNIWDLNNLYYESMQLPLGASSDYMGEFLKSKAFTHSGRFDTQKFRLKPDEKNVIYVVDNKIGDIIDRKDAEFADAKRQIVVKNDDIQRNNGLEKALQRFLGKQQNNNQVWEQYHYPAIQMKHRLGLAWTNVDWDEMIGENGQLTWRLFHPRDVLLDILPEQKYFLDARHIIPKMRLPLAAAKDYLEQFGIDRDSVTPDDDYFYNNEPMKARYRTNDGVALETEWVTLYFPEYRRIFIERSNSNGEDFSRQAAQQGRRGAKAVWYFNGVYNKKLGMVHFSKSKYYDPRMLEEWQFRFFPWNEKMSNVRLYPISLVEKYLNIQDIINISETIILESARQRNRLRAVTMGTLKAKYGPAFDDWMNYGGILDNISPADIPEGKGIKDIIDFIDYPGLSQEHYTFFEKMEMSLKEQTQTKEVLGGALPNARGEYLSGETIKELTARNQVRLQPDQMNVAWPATQEVRRVYRIAATELTSDDWVEIEDKTNAQNSKTSPTNKSMTLAEYKEFIMRTYPKMDLMMAIEEFEKENYVDYTIMKRDPERGVELNDREIEEAGSEVRINYLYRTSSGEAHKFEIRVDFDFGFKQQEENDKQTLGMIYRDTQELEILRRLLKKMSPDLRNEADDIIEDIKKGKEVLQIGEAVMKRGPEFQQIVADTAQRFDIAVQAQKGAGGNKPAQLPAGAAA